MPINNINTLVNKDILEYINNENPNSNYLLKYYNEALANLGQRNIEDRQISFVTYTIEELISEVFELLNTAIQTPASGYLEIRNTGRDLFCNISEFDDIRDSQENDNKTVIIRTKINLLYELLDKFKELYDHDYTIEHILYFPLNYTFEYLSDGINKTNIYGSVKDIYLDILPIGTSIPQNIYCPFIFNKQSYQKSEVYEYSFILGEDNDYEISIERKYQLPYISENNKWVLDGYETDIQAKSKDSMNLNIVLAVSNVNDSSFTVLSGLNKNVYYSDINGSFVGYGNDDKIYCKTNNGDVFNIGLYLPKINIDDNSIEIESSLLSSSMSYDKALTERIFANSTMIVMAKAEECILADTDEKKQKLIGEFGNGYITTIWNYDTNTKDWTYIYVENDGDGNHIALDLSELTNFNNLLKAALSRNSQIEPDNYLHSWLIFDAADNSLKHTTDSNKDLHYPILRNLEGSLYSNNYHNNFNFVLQYVNEIKGEPGKNILSANNTDNNQFLNLTNITENSTLVTNSIYYISEGSKITNYPEYIPNYNIPLLDLNEVLVKDSNIINRQNILTFDSSGNIYYSYIGSSFDTYDKKTLRIGTSNLNLNLGTLNNQSIISPADKTKFKKNEVFSIDFDEVVINGQTNIKQDTYISGNIYHEKPTWTTSKLGDKTIYSTSIVPKFKYNKDTQGAIYNILNIDTIEDGIKSLPIKDDPNYLYTNIILSKKINNIDYYFKHNDLLCISNFLKYIGIDQDNLILESNTNDIIKINGVEKYLVSSSNQLSDFITIEMKNSSGISISSINVDYFIGNTLDLVYSIDGSTRKLTINEHKSRMIQSIWKIPTNIIS